MPKKRKAVKAQKVVKDNSRGIEIQNQLIQQLINMKGQQDLPSEYTLPSLPPNVLPQGELSGNELAMDSCCGVASYANTDPAFYSGFLGYPQLSVMAQSSDYRMVPETTALEMTREWGKVKIVGDGDESSAEKITLIEERMKELQVRDLMRQHIQNELTFGSSHLFIDIAKQDEDLPLIYKNIKKDSLKGFRLVEPIHCTPAFYNATNALEEDFYKPSIWYVLATKVHSDRLLTLVMRPVPNLLKPAYNFGGVSMMQLMKPYVQRWQRTVDSVSDLIHAFSLTGLKTDMQNILSGGEDGMSQLVLRAQMFGTLRDNLNTMLVDKEGEELFQINTPLTTLDALVTKAQEQMAMPAHTPLVKLTGITPSGLNASSDGEIRVYNDWISSLQEAYIRPQIDKVLSIVQMDLFGEIDQSIVFEFNSLHQLNEVERSTVNLNKAQEANLYAQNGVVSQEEIRESLSKEEFGNYGFIDVSKVPEMPEVGFTEQEDDIIETE